MCALPSTTSVPASRRSISSGVSRSTSSRSIVRSSRADDAKSATITANVTSLAHTLGLVAVAEGIETQGQLTSAKALGCDLAQGYLFTRPVPADDITQLLVADETAVADCRCRNPWRARRVPERRGLR